jgi:hypothetical protein
MADIKFHLGVFVDWANHYLLEEGSTGKLTICEPTSKPAAYVEFDTNRVISRITAWDSGEIHGEVLEIMTGQQIFSEHVKVANRSDFVDFLRRFFGSVNFQNED